MKKIFIGIDFAKEKLDVTIICAQGFEETAPRQYNTFANDKKGFSQLIKWVKASVGKQDQSVWLFCGEDTGAYSQPLSRWLYGKGLDVWIESAYEIKHRSGLQRSKNDRDDSALIAEYAMRHNDRAKLFEPMSQSLTDLRELFHYRHKLVQERTAIQVRMQNKQTVQKSKTMSFIRRDSQKRLNFLKKSIAQCDSMIDQLIQSDDELRENYEIITSITGVARQNGACLLIFTNNFTRFNMDPRKIACYYGVAPFAKQSGSSLHTNGSTSHFSNRLLTSLLTQAAQAAKRYCPEIKDYYEGLIARGKHRSVALNNVKCKLLTIITALVRKKQKYDPYVYVLNRDKYREQLIA